MFWKGSSKLKKIFFSPIFEATYHISKNLRPWFINFAKRPKPIAVDPIPVVEALNSKRRSIKPHILANMSNIFILDQIRSD